MHNDVRASTGVDETAVSVRGESDPSVPEGSDNYLVRGAHAVFSLAGRKPPALNFEVDAKVPVSRGLGSSANALVSGAMAANALLDDPLDPSEIVFALVEIEGHSEQLAACLFGGLVGVAPPDTATSVLGRPAASPSLFSLPVESSLHVALAVPELRLETKRARSVLPHDVPFGDAVANIASVAALCQGLRDGDGFLVRIGMRDRLHQDARAELNPASRDVMAAARDAGAWGACWSGAGPTILAICEDVETAMQAAEAMVGAFDTHKVSASPYACPVDFDGCAITQLDGKQLPPAKGTPDDFDENTIDD